MKLTKVITLEMEEDIWRKFKEIVPRTITLNKALGNLVRDFVSDKEAKRK